MVTSRHLAAALKSRRLYLRAPMLRDLVPGGQFPGFAAPMTDVRQALHARVLEQLPGGLDTKPLGGNLPDERRNVLRLPLPWTEPVQVHEQRGCLDVVAP